MSGQSLAVARPLVAQHDRASAMLNDQLIHCKIPGDVGIERLSPNASQLSGFLSGEGRLGIGFLR